MSLREKIEADFKKALKEKKELTLSTLRMLRAALIDREKQKRFQLLSKESFSEEELANRVKLSDEEIIQVVSSQVKKRKESIEAYKKGGREDLVEREEKEIEVLKNYLPEQLSKEEIEKMVKEIINKIGASDIKDMGKVMKEILEKIKGKADGKTISEIVKRLLSK